MRKIKEYDVNKKILWSNKTQTTTIEKMKN